MKAKKFSQLPLDTGWDDYGSWKGSKGGKGVIVGPRCYESHKPMPLNDGLFIHGGSCYTPIVKDADLYLALDAGARETRPWDTGPQTVRFPITDMQPPSNASEFLKMLDWLVPHIAAGKKVHVGCIGGHGRTGTVLSAVVRIMMNEKDAIRYVREHYCKKAVETEGQIKFLKDVFDITPVTATKTFSTAPLKSSGVTSTGTNPTYFGKLPVIRSKSCIWGPTAVPTLK